MCMEAASTGSVSPKLWRQRVQEFFQNSHLQSNGEFLLLSIQQAKAKLNGVLVGLVTEKHNYLLDEVQEQHTNKNPAAALREFAQQWVKCSDERHPFQSGTIQKQIDQVLHEFNCGNTEVKVMDNPAIPTATTGDSTLASSEDLELGGSESTHSSSYKRGRTKPFEPHDEEIQRLKIDLTQLVYKEKDLIGGGGFAEVFKGRYQGEQ